MNLKKISEEHYIVMDDSETKEGDWIYNAEREPSILKCVGKGSLRGWQKITHSTQPLGFLNEHGFTTANLKPDWTNVEYLPLSEAKEILGVVDVEKKAQIEWGNVHRTGVLGYIDGYNQALEDNKEKKWTDTDMVHAYKMGLMRLSDHRLKDYMLPKTEWEVEMVDGKLKLKQ